MKRKTFCVLLALVLCVGMSACAAPAEPTLTLEDFTYRLTSKDGKAYIVLDHAAVLEETELLGCQSAGLDFDSMKDLVDTVTQGKLEHYQKALMAQAFPKDENGILSCDFQNMYEPSLPEGAVTGDVSWYGDYYAFSLNLGNGVHGDLQYLPEYGYRTLYQKNYENRFEQENYTVTKTEQLEGNITAIYYSTDVSRFRVHRYTLEADGKVYHVDKDYCLWVNNPSLSSSETIPGRIMIYCEDGSNRYYIYMYGLTEDPTDEWLLSIGLKRYVDNGHVDK